MTSPSKSLGRTLVPVALAVATCLWFGWSVEQHWFIGDDAYISFRYAENLVNGHGIVFNPGERVEGYTNFLWVLLMAAWMALGGDPETASLALGTLCGAAVIGLVAWSGARAVGWSSPLAWVAPLCLAANRSFTAWCSGGLETQLFSALVLAGFLAFLAGSERKEARPWGAALLFALAALTRPEGMLFFGLCWLAFAWQVQRGRRPRSALLVFTATFVPIVAAHVTWRLLYYGAPLPNTFYAKVSGHWFSQGFSWLAFFGEQHWIGLAIALALFALALAPDLQQVLLVGVLGVYTAYLAYVGGDRFEFRLLVPALPLIYLTAERGLQVLATTTSSAGPRLPRAMALVLAAALVGTAALPTLRTRDATFPNGVYPTEAVGYYAKRRAREGRILHRLVEKGFLTGDEVIAVTGAGAMPYFAGFPTVDLHGLNDATISKQPLEHRGIIGHEKYASTEYLESRKVAIWDVRNGTLQGRSKGCPKKPHYTSPLYDGPIHCVKAEDHILVFATTLNPEEFARTFSAFEIVY